jgi:hypothetical protein
VTISFRPALRRQIVGPPRILGGCILSALSAGIALEAAFPVR